MSKKEKLLHRLRSRNQDYSWKMEDVKSLLQSCGFSLERVKGSHHIYEKEGSPPINVQPTCHGEAKPYQIKQIRSIILGDLK
jgi:predicted RNA binding protein YcfA (HicA-like mRNA interferase family)